MYVITNRRGVVHLGDMPLTARQCRRWLEVLQGEQLDLGSPIHAQVKKLAGQLMDASQAACAERRAGASFADAQVSQL